MYKSKAVTYVLTGGVIAAFLGPTSATYTVNIFSEKYVASFMAMAIIGVLNQIAVSLLCCDLKPAVIIIPIIKFLIFHR